MRRTLLPDAAAVRLEGVRAGCPGVVCGGQPPA